MSKPALLSKLHKLPSDDPLIQRMMGREIYVIDQELIEILPREDIQRSIAALLEAGLGRLPHPEMVVEFTLRGTAWAVLLEDTPGHIRAHVVGAYLGMITISTNPATATTTTNGINISGAASEADAGAIVMAVAAALLLLNTKGVDKDVIHPQALNKARRLRGETPIPTHTLIRIGRIYDRNGIAHIQEGKRRPMPVHIRAGYTRMQFFGEGRAERRLVYIPPVVVNFSGETPEARERGVRL